MIFLVAKIPNLRKAHLCPKVSLKRNSLPRIVQKNPVYYFKGENVPVRRWRQWYVSWSNALKWKKNLEKSLLGTKENKWLRIRSWTLTCCTRLWTRLSGTAPNLYFYKKFVNSSSRIPCFRMKSWPRSCSRC